MTLTIETTVEMRQDRNIFKKVVNGSRTFFTVHFSKMYVIFDIRTRDLQIMYFIYGDYIRNRNIDNDNIQWIIKTNKITNYFEIT